jgi:hypothetical protein
MLCSACLVTTLLVAVGQAQVVKPTVAAAAPGDVEIPDGFAADPVFFFDDFSWRTFVALNWPALGNQRGEPDTNKAFGDQAENVVWGTWKADHEIFQPNGMEPSPWDSFAAQSPDRFTTFEDAGKVKVLGGFGARGSDLQIEHYNQAGILGNEQGTLVDRNRRYVRYEVRINKPEFNFIRHGKFYLAANLPVSGQLVFPEGSGEIKAAWRLFSEAEASDPKVIGRYYTTHAVLVDPNGSSAKAKVGLIGLHIVRRTPSRPEWIWSSFEHVDNLSGSSSTLLVSANDPDENKLRPVVNKTMAPVPNPDPVPVRRLRPVREETAKVNDAYQSHAAIKNTVWKNYQLVLTQWPRTPAADEQQFVKNFALPYPVGAGNPSPTDNSGNSIANVTMETTTLFQQGVSCMQCHFNAGKFRHTEFVWTVPLRAFHPNVAVVAKVREQVQENVKPLMDALEAAVKK